MSEVGFEVHFIQNEGAGQGIVHLKHPVEETASLSHQMLQPPTRLKQTRTLDFGEVHFFTHLKLHSHSRILP